MKLRNEMNPIIRAVRRRRRRKAVRRAILITLALVFCFTLGVFLGVHHRVLRALLTGEQMPKPPKNHPALCRFPLLGKKNG